MADALMGVTELAARKTEISNIAQTYLVQESILMPTVSDFSYLAGPGVANINLPRSGGFTVGDKSENTAIDAQVITYSQDTLALSTHRAVQFLAEDIASMQSVIGIQDAVMKATKDLALDIDKKIIAALLAGPSTSTPDHSVVFADTATDVIAKADILAARALLRAQDIDPRECYILVGPEKESQLLSLSDFIQAERYGSNSPVMNGEFGTLFGMKVIVHSGVTDYMLTYHKSALGYALQEGIKFDTDKDLANLGMRYSLSYVGGFKVLDSGKRHVLTDSTN